MSTICWNNTSFKEIEQKLLLSNIKRTISVYEYLNIPDRKYNPTAFLLFLDNDLKAVFKPDRFHNQRQGAVMAYKFSQFMNFKFVPPTVIRTLNGKKGIVRFVIESVSELKEQYIKNLSPVERSDIFVFYFVLGERDANRYNVLFEISSGKPVLVDNETNTTVSFIPYGDFPFRSSGIKGGELTITSPEEYAKFPLEQVKKTNSNSLTELKSMLSDMLDSEFEGYFIPWCFNRRAYLHDGNLYFVRWNNAYWIRHNMIYYKEIFKDLLPHIFSKKTIEQLKKLDYQVLKSFLPDYAIKDSIIFAILYRRDVLLKEAYRLNRFCA